MSNIITMKYINDIGIKKLIYENIDHKKIYILNNGYKFKEFPKKYQSLDDPYNMMVYKQLLEQSKIDLETINVPEKIIVEGNSIYGYIAPFIEGIPIKDIDPDFLITELFAILSKLESDIKALSKEGWMMEDFHDQNLLINKELSTTSIIDTDCYYKTKEEVLKRNMTALFNIVIYSILPRIQLSKAFRNKIIQQYFYMSSQGLMATSDFLRHLLIEIKQRVITGITVEDIKKKLK